MPTSRSSNVGFNRSVCSGLIFGLITLATGYSTFKTYSAGLEPKQGSLPAKTKSSSAISKSEQRHLAQNYGQFGITAEDIDTEAFLKGFLTAFKGDKPEVAEESLKASMQALGDLLQTREKERGSLRVVSRLRSWAASG